MTGAGTRIYLGNLPSEVTEKEIKKRLKSFGRAAEVDIKHRTDHEGKITATFAHLTVAVEKGNLDQCLEYLNEQQWNGYTAKAEVAKESYLKRMEAKRANSLGEIRGVSRMPVEPQLSKYQKVAVTPKPLKFDKSTITFKSEKTPEITISPKYMKPKNGKEKGSKSESKKRKSRDCDSSDSEAEVFWQKGVHKDNTVTIDTETSHKQSIPRGQKQSNSLLNKLESFSSVWDDPAPAPFRDSYTYSTPSRIREESPSKIYQKGTEERNFNEQTNETVDSNKHIKNIYNEKKSEVVEDNKTQIQKKKSIKKYDGSKSKSLANNFEYNNVSSVPPPNVDKYTSSKGKSPSDLKKIQADEKRRKSVNERVDAIQQQQETVRKALAGEPVNKKIRFDEEEEQPGESVLTNGSTAAKLFDDESDQDEQQNDFAIRQQFEGRKGEKLLELQARFATDDRFRLDQRFAESDSEEGEAAEEEAKEGEESNEQQQQLDILNSILGPNQAPTAKLAKKQEKGMKVIVRFDPSKADHSQKYTVNTEQPSKKKKKRHEMDEDDGAIETNETPMPEVSSERFYEVSETLQKALVPAGSQDKFSLRSLFGGQQEEDESGEEENKASVEEAAVIQEPSRQKRKVKNPMDFEAEEVTTEVPTLPASVVGATWSETFFFKQDDPRLQEGVEFFRSAKREGKEEFEQRRHELWVSVKAKLRNVARKKVTFERKLGGRSTKPGRGGKPGGRGGKQGMSRGNNSRRR